VEQHCVFYSCGVPLEAILTIPDGGGPAPRVVALCHGHSRQKDDGLDRLAARLSEKGIAAFRFDFRGCGQSPQKYRLMCATEWPEDLQHAVTYLASDRRVDPDRIGVAGISMGAGTAVYASAVDRRIKCLVAMAAVGNGQRVLTGMWKRYLGAQGCEEMIRRLEADRVERVRTGVSSLITSSFMCGRTGDQELEFMIADLKDSLRGKYNNSYVSLEGVDSLFGFSAEAVCGRIGVPSLYLHGEDDELIDPSESKRLCELTGSATKEFRLLPGLDHNMPMSARRESVFDHVVGWFERHL
jgi:uncharacterized protein